MATMNLLQGGIQGSMGVHTGVRRHGKNIVKAKIWSKTPPNEVQTDSVRSFEALNRISAAIAKKFWYWMPFKQGNMHKHNVIASEFKSVVAAHTFNPAAIGEIIPAGDKITVSEFTVNPESGKITVSLAADLAGITGNWESVLVLVFDSHGDVYFSEKMTVPWLDTEIEAPLKIYFPYCLVAFSSTKRNGKITLGNFTLRRTLPENVFYTENYGKIRWWTEEPNRLCGEGAGISTSGVTLVVDGTIG